MPQPIQKFRAGSVSCAIWENEVTANDRTFTARSVTFERWYRDKNGEWKSTTSFKEGDFRFLRYVINKADTYLIEERSITRDNVEEETVQ